MSDFWLRKMRTYFHRFDLNKNGVITSDDFLGCCTRFVERGTLDEVRGKQLEEQLTKLFSAFSDGNVEEALNEERFIASLKKQVSDPNFHQNCIEPLTVAFNGIDSNGDGGIHLDELMLFFEILGFDKSIARDTFEALDTDQDGTISLEEWLINGVEFFTSEDESRPSKLFWGPLV